MGGRQREGRQLLSLKGGDGERERDGRKERQSVASLLLLCSLQTGSRELQPTGIH